MATNSAEGVRWDLSDLFASHDDPRIDTTLKDCRTRAETFATRFRPVLENPETLTATALLDAMKELEIIYEALGRVGSYAGLLYAADTTNPDYQNLEQRVEQRSTEIRNLLLFFEIQWLKADDAIANRLIADPTLKTYSHYLQSLRRYRQHTLSEPEEKIVNEKDNTGRNAFGRLFSEITSSLSFTFERDDKKEELNLSQILSLLHEPGPSAAPARPGHALSGSFPARPGADLRLRHADPGSFDHGPPAPLSDPMAQRHLFNEIDGEAVKTMMAVTERNYGLAHNYFGLKAKLLRLPRLALHDQYAPVGKEVRPFPYDQAQQVILEAFEAFDPRFRQIAAEFFAKNWIDAEIRKGKRGGAFCASPSPQLHPYILCNYDDNLRDVMTVAHELGHGLHGCLSRKQNYFNYDTPLTTAETASVFGEMLVFDYLLAQQTDPQVQIALLAGKIEDIFATVFRQNVLTRFEELAFAARKEKRLTPDTSRKPLARSQRQILRRRRRHARRLPLGLVVHPPLHPLALLLLQLRLRPASRSRALSNVQRRRQKFRAKISRAARSRRLGLARRRCSSRSASTFTTRRFGRRGLRRLKAL